MSTIVTVDTAADPAAEPIAVELTIRPDATCAELLAALQQIGSAGQLWLGRQEIAGPLPVRSLGLRQGSELTAHPRPVAGRELWIAGGPDAGQRIRLGPNTSSIGRADDADLTLSDPAVSRHHARIVTSDDGSLRIEDLGSANGTTELATPLGPITRVGNTLLRPADYPPPALITAVVDGRAVIRPVLRPLAAAEEPDPVPPAAPAAEPAIAFPWLGVLLPFGAAILLVVLLQSMIMLAFAVLSPLMGLGQYVTDRRRRHVRTRAAATHHAEEISAHRALLAARVQQRERSAALTVADPAECAAIATVPGNRLWERAPNDPQRGTVRIGTVLGEHAQPATLDLGTHRVIGLLGDKAGVVAEWIAIQLAIWRAPGTVAIEARSPAMDWVRWLPHHAGNDGTGGRTTSAGAAELVLITADAADAAAAAGATIVLADAPVQVPHATAFVTTGADDPFATITIGEQTTSILLDDPPAGFAPSLARTLAGYACADGPSGGAVAFHDLHPLDPAAIVDTWADASAPLLRIGRAGREPVELDLAGDGPHALVAGTTGSGKSELLQTMVASLAVQLPPSRLALVLIDYKGGAAFGACAELPHCSGLVTDLDGASTARALEALRAEIRRREQLLNAAGVPDLARLPERAAGAGVPRLVIVVDEFATLAEELPDFLSGLVDVARRGRSLGVHLVLATQRPSGVVDADIRANAALRICLRVTDDAESDAVIESAAAARLTAPGQAIIRCGTRLVEVQVAYLGAPAADRHPVVAHRVGMAPAQPPVTDLELLLAAVGQAARLANEQRPPAPWLEPLPKLLPSSKVPPGCIGLEDDVAGRANPPHFLDLARGPLLIAGGPGTGRTTALKAALAAAAATHPDMARYVIADPVHFSGRWASQVIPARETDRLRRLFRLALARLDQPGSPFLLAVDGIEALLEADDLLADQLLALADRGRGAGIGLILTAGRAGLVGRISGAISHRLILPPANRDDFLLAGVRPADVPAELPAGRCWSGTHWMQIVMAEEPESVPSRWNLARLPRRIEWPAQAGEQSDAVMLGVGGDDQRPISTRLVPPGFLIAGPARSGRSSALRLIGQQLLVAQEQTVLALTPRSSPLQHLDIIQISADCCSELDRLLDRDRGLIHLVDDLELIESHPLFVFWPRIEARSRDGLDLVVAAGTTELLASYGSPAAALRRDRRGIVLMPRAAFDGDLLGARLEPTEPVAGRGVLIDGPQCTTLQLYAPADP